MIDGSQRCAKAIPAELRTAAATMWVRDAVEGRKFLAPVSNFHQKAYEVGQLCLSLFNHLILRTFSFY